MSYFKSEAEKFLFSAFGGSVFSTARTLPWNRFVTRIRSTLMQLLRFGLITSSNVSDFQSKSRPHHHAMDSNSSSVYHILHPKEHFQSIIVRVLVLTILTSLVMTTTASLGLFFTFDSLWKIESATFEFL